jgi:hypothetical protein
MVLLVPSTSSAKTSPVTSPATFTTSLPRPPITRVATPGDVERTSIASSPSSASISRTSIRA